MNITRLFTAHRKPLLAGLLILLAAFVFTFPLHGGAYGTRVLTTMLMYTVLAVSWTMFSGATGYMSLAPAAFFGTGIYSTALLQDYLRDLAAGIKHYVAEHPEFRGTDLWVREWPYGKAWIYRRDTERLERCR